MSIKPGVVLAACPEYPAMFESRSPYDRLETRPDNSLRRGNGPRKQGTDANSVPRQPPHRPTPRPLHADPPILMISGRRRHALRSRGFMGILLIVCAVLVTIAVAQLFDSDQTNVTSRAVLPATPTEQTAPVEAPSPAQPEPVPSPPEPVTPAPAVDSSAETVAAPEQREPPAASAQTPEPTGSQPATTPEAARGFLFINSRPWGRVLIDGRPIGNTPVVRVPIAPGTHELRVERDGFHPFETIITVDPGTDLRLTEIVLRSVIS